MIHGVPHLYESCWLDIAGKEDDVFVVSPISESLLSAELEDWAIWKRWQDAHKTGNATIESHPALPEDWARHEFLVQILKNRLVIDEGCKFAAIAKFRYNQNDPKMEAEWTMIPYDQAKDHRLAYRCPEDENGTNNPME
ncbi:MAG: hypothetical protein U0905_19670 [Pirellulales bacterium]